MFNTVIALLGSAAGGEQGGLLQMLITLAPLLLVFVVMYFMMIRPQRKREKEIEKMRAELEVGDEVITSGGVVGLVVSLREDSVTIETGSDRSKIRVMRWAIQKNNTIHD
ncbi:MAG: preprotein translocase subunit YajC [Oscillospiraceae bacterium]|nr:preprotein translocase subunit YajC [Oscillospiraceae bacterium]MBQ9939079.1 preprotein translocase subunit YajC [Oscillospiraceae bacterium]